MNLNIFKRLEEKEMNRSKQYLARFLVIVFVIGLLAGYGGTSQAADQTISMKLATSASAMGISGRTFTFFAQALKEESQGTLLLEVFPASSLISDPDMLDALMRGNVDVGHLPIAHLSVVMNELIPLEVPGALPGGKFLEFADALRPNIDRVMNKYGIKYVGRIAADDMVFVGNIQVKTASDLAGAKVRTAGKWAGEAVVGWGGSAVAITISELSSALERKIVDLAHTNWVPVMSFSLYDVSKYVSVTNMAATFSCVVMSDITWQKLSPNQKEAFTRACKRLEKFNIENTEREYEVFIKTATENNCEVYVMTPEENETFMSEVDKLLEVIRPSVGSEGAELIELLKSMSE